MKQVACTWQGRRWANLCLRLALGGLFLGICPVIQALDCVPADIALSSQAEVDSFQADHGGGAVCNEVVGDLRVVGADISNLGPLSDLTAVGNDLAIESTMGLASLGGLSALTQVGGNFGIRFNQILETLDGLDVLTHIGGTLQIADNPSLSSFTGLSAMVSVSGIVIEANAALTALAGLQAPQLLARGLWIKGNGALTDIGSLAAVESIGGSLEIGMNAHLGGIPLNALTRVGTDLLIYDNAELSDVSPLSQLISVGGDFYVADNPVLSDCTALQALLDEGDDEPPGPGFGPVPDVGQNIYVERNAQGCNSTAQIFSQIMADGFESRNQFSVIEYNAPQASCDLAIGADGYPVISYLSSWRNLLRVGKCSDSRCDRVGLSRATVGGQELYSNYSNSLEIGVDGWPIIAYGVSFMSVGYVKVVECNDLACLGGDEADSVVTPQGLHGGPSLAVGADGLPVISYYEGNAYEGNATLNAIKCSAPSCALGAKTISVIDSESERVGTDSSIAIGFDGLPVISYRDVTNGDLKVAKCNDAACAGGDESISSVDDSANSVGFFSSLAIGADGFPVVAYVDITERALKVAKCNDAACSGGDEIISTLDAGATDTVANPSIAIGADGAPVISYSDASDWSVKVAKCNDAACSGGDEEIHRVDGPGRWTSIAIGKDGLPDIVYCGGIELGKPVKFLSCGTLDCRP
jgi:hypothetical protein